MRSGNHAEASAPFVSKRSLPEISEGRFVIMGMDHVFGCVTIAEMKDFRMMCEIADAIMEEPIAEREVFRGLSDGKRNTEKQASLYDAMMAEIYAERNKAKARRVRKPDNRTRAERLADWDAEKDRRKDRRIDAKCNHINKKYGYLCIEQERRISAETVAREDYEIELRNIAEDAERDAIEAEIREWERKHAIEQANARAWMAMQKWLEWA